MKISILDGFVDEPSCLGVPPYISPYPRYMVGAIRSAGHDYEYVTIEQFRSGSRLSGEVLVLIAGPVVPGRYLRGMPISPKEIISICRSFDGIRILGGPLARFGMYDEGVRRSFDHLAEKDPDAYVHDFLSGGTVFHRSRDMTEWREWAILGSEVVRDHPDFPQPLMTEIDSWRGCVRYVSGGCSFCIEPLYGKPEFRRIEDIIEEVHQLYAAGARNFRLGGQSCIFSYLAEGIGETDTPKPNPKAIEKLLKGIHRVAPDLCVLHTDNANPAVIATHPTESKQITRHLVKYCTGGNVLSFGVESVDPEVIETNNLNADANQSMRAISLVNEIGSERGQTGLPRLLPGINFLAGLRGETGETFTLNLSFLKNILHSGLMLRRINIRQVFPVRGKFKVSDRRAFRQFKSAVREEIDRPMIERVLPRRTVLKDVYLEIHRGRNTFGRQVGTYPLLVGLPYQTSLDRFIDVVVISHGYRSVTGVESPLNVNEAPLDALTALPGVGKKRAARIVRARPFSDVKEFMNAVDDKGVAREVSELLSY